VKVIVINGSPKQGGFIGGALDVIASHIEAKAVTVRRLSLAESSIGECLGCFNCLRTGSCVLDDDMDDIIKGMLEADGLVMGSPVRNGLTTACYKRFYERITYRLGFTLLLEGKHTLAISSVGFMGGKAVNRKFLGLEDIGARTSDYLFFRVGIPSKINGGDVRDRLERAADRFLDDIENARPRRLFSRIGAAVDRITMGQFMFKKSPDLYAHVIECWRKKGYMK